MRVDEIMTKAVITIAPEEAAERAWERMRLQDIRHLVVTRGTRLAGVLSERDLGGVRGGEVRRNVTVSDRMTPQVVTVNPHTTIREAANLMRGHRIGCLPVTEDGRLVGIVTRSDLLELIGHRGEGAAGRTKEPKVKQVRRMAREIRNRPRA